MQGVVVSAVPTPFTQDGEVDTATARQLFKFIAESTDGMLIAGSTGEFPALDDSERLELIDAGLEIAGVDRVIAQVGAPDAHRAVRLATDAVRLGATTIAAITPFYNPVSPGELADYYAAVRDAAPSADLYAYIFPDRTGVQVPVDLFASVAEAVGLGGAKLSGSAARDVAAFAAAAPQARVYSGDDSDLAGVLKGGGAGVISARSSAYPEVFMGLASALAAGDAATATSWQSFVSDIVATGASIGRVKEALRLRGFGPLGSRMPVGWPAGSLATEIEALVRRLPGSAA
jgi:4-hydroxy-tetrahydrodipicolinate synthase